MLNTKNIVIFQLIVNYNCKKNNIEILNFSYILQIADNKNSCFALFFFNVQSHFNFENNF